MTVTDLLSRISARELAEWQAYELVFGPIGPQRDDILAALISAHLTNALAGGKGRKPVLADFLPRWGVTREEVGHGDDQKPAGPPGGGR